MPGWAQQDAAGADLPEDDAGDGGLQHAGIGGADAAPEVLAGNIEPDQAWADEAEARVIAELEDRGVAGAARAVDAAAGDAAAGEDGFAYEEQVLRELVRDIIREELQGGLGERITRNIRKLVRAEIARAMATQALD